MGKPRSADSGRVDRLTFDGEHGNVDTDVLTGRAYSSLTRALTTSLRGEDARKRVRLAFDQTLPVSALWADSLRWHKVVFLLAGI